MVESMAELALDLLGAFADGGILFPLLILLTLHGAFSAPILFASAGVAYLVSGRIFKVPMPIQPLKSIAASAILLGASGCEVRLSGALVGFFCLLVAFARLDRFARKVPVSLIHCVQLGLGVVLFTQGCSALSHSSPLRIAAAICFFALMVFFTARPLLGIVASLGLIVGGLFPSMLPHASLNAAQASPSTLRWMMIVSLVFPQLALTLTNSVLATVDVAKRCYGERASKVSERNLLLSVGFGNLVSGAIGGLPYCHGSGGVTAHYRGGAKTERSNYVIGVFLLLLALIGFSGKVAVFGYPGFLLASLLMAVGVFHLRLARETWELGTGKIRLLLCGLVAAATENMLYVLIAAVFSEFVMFQIGMLGPRKAETA